MDNIVENEDILAGFSCERLSSNELNKDLIKKVVSKRGESLVGYLQSDAWKEDEDGSTAFYVVKNSKQEICLFFSLKCCSLFDSLFDDEYTLSKINDFLTKFDEKTNSESNPPTSSIEELISHVKKCISLSEKVKSYRDDQKREKNSNVIRVSHTYSGLELVHFCIDDKAKMEWKKKNSRYSLGEIIFWKFIVPIALEAQELVGLKYLILFAADLTEDETLINYYKSVLKFECPNDISTNKPAYDFCCMFMSQKLNDLRKHQREFLAELGKPSEDAV